MRICALAVTLLLLLAGCGRQAAEASSLRAEPGPEAFGTAAGIAPELTSREEAAVSALEEPYGDSEPEAVESVQETEPASGETAPPESEPEPEIPAFAWEAGIPEDYGVDGSVLEGLHSRYPALPVLSAVVYKDGHILDEYYADGYDADSLFLLNSASKSIMSALVGIAVDQGLIESVDMPVAEFFPQLAESDDPRAQEITIRHLLTHTAGFSSTDDTDWDSWRSAQNWVDYVLSQPITAQPGTTFRYFTGNTHLLSAIIQSVSGMSAYEYGVKYLFAPLGIEDVTCDTDPQGISDGGNGFHLSPRDMVKFGLLYLDQGVWQGQQIISREWVAASTSLQFQRNSGTADYGYQWWVRTFGDGAYPAYFAQGHAGQYIFVVPDLDLIVTMTSDYEGATGVYWEFVNEIVNAVG